MISTGDVILLVAAGVLAGIVGTAGAITSLVSYPALLLVGLSPLAAGIANVVAVLATWPGSAITSRPELAGRGRWLVRHLPVAGVGGAIGAALLLLTPATAFERIVPLLVAGGSLVLLASPRLGALRAARTGTPDRPAPQPAWMDPAVVAVSVYNGYFGAGAGVMLLALCLVCVDPVLPRANALKNMLVGAATVTGAIALAVFGNVRWAAVLPLMVGLLAGGALGPLVARRIPERILRPLAAAFGIGLAVQLWLTHGA